MKLHKLAIWVVGAALWAASSSVAQAAIQEKVLEYRHGDTVLEGVLVYDDAAAKRPGVLVVHEWMGLGEHVKTSARRLAEAGYTALAVDMYGKGVRANNQEEAAALAGIYKTDRDLMRGRIQAALEALRQESSVEPARVSAIGYCFGGTTVLELARSGADIKSAVSFHGGLSTTMPAAAGAVQTKVLALHGGNDPYVPDDEVGAFAEEMRASGADWQLVVYGGAVHSFTNPDAGTDPSKGAAYNEHADRRSWDAMTLFLKETL